MRGGWGGEEPCLTNLFQVNVQLFKHFQVVTASAQTNVTPKADFLF